MLFAKRAHWHRRLAGLEERVARLEQTDPERVELLRRQKLEEQWQSLLSYNGGQKGGDTHG